MNGSPEYNMLKDDLSAFVDTDPAFVTFGETMIRDTPADTQRAERTRQVDISPSGSEFILAVGMARLGIRCSYIASGINFGLAPHSGYDCNYSFITIIDDMARIYGMGCGHCSAGTISKGDTGTLGDGDLQSMASQIIDQFRPKVVGITIRYPNTFKTHRWESAAQQIS